MLFRKAKFTPSHFTPANRPAIRFPSSGRGYKDCADEKPRVAADGERRPASAAPAGTDPGQCLTRGQPAHGSQTPAARSPSLGGLQGKHINGTVGFQKEQCGGGEVKRFINPILCVWCGSDAGWDSSRGTFLAPNTLTAQIPSSAPIFNPTFDGFLHKSDNI